MALGLISLIFEVQSHSSMHLDFVLLDWIILYCFPFISWWTQAVLTFWQWWITLWMCTCIWVPVFSSLEYVPRIRIVGPEYYYAKDSFCPCVFVWLSTFFFLSLSVCLSLSILCVCVYRGHRRTLDPLELELQVILSLSDMGARNWILSILC